MRATGRIVRDAGALMGGDVVDRGLGFVFLIAATKLFGLEIYGAYQLALAVFQVVRTLVSFGLGRSIVRDTAAASASGEPGRIKGAILLGLGISCSMAFVLGGALYVFSPTLISVVYPTHPEAIEPLRIFGLLTPLFAVNFVLLQAFYGLDRIRLMVVANNIVEPVSRLGALVVLFGLGVAGYYALPFSYLIALVVSSLFAIVFFRRFVWRMLSGVKADLRVRETLAFTIPVTLNDLATRSFRSLNIFFLAPFLSSTQLGVFSVALKLTSVVLFFSGSLTGAFRPRIARLMATGEHVELERETRAYNRWILTFALLPFGLLIMFPVPILNALGWQYVPVAGAMRYFAAGLLIAQSSGPLMALLLMSGRSKAPLAFFVLGGGTYTALSVWAVPRYGVEGVAMAALVAIVVFIPMLAAYVQRKVGIQMYSWTMWKPLAAGLAAFPVGYLVSRVVPEIRYVDAAAIVGATTAVYGAVLYLLGAEREERELLDHLLGRRSRLVKKLKKLLR